MKQGPTETFSCALKFSRWPAGSAPGPFSRSLLSALQKASKTLFQSHSRSHEQGCKDSWTRLAFVSDIVSQVIVTVLIMVIEAIIPSLLQFKVSCALRVSSGEWLLMPFPGRSIRPGGPSQGLEHQLRVLRLLYQSILARLFARLVCECPKRGQLPLPAFCFEHEFKLLLPRHNNIMHRAASAARANFKAC